MQRSICQAHANLSFQQADVAALDVALVQFRSDLQLRDTEHLQAQKPCSPGFGDCWHREACCWYRRRIGTTTLDVPGFNNEHHVRELYRHEFEAMLAKEFREVRLYAHKLAFQSLLWSLDGSRDSFVALTLDAQTQVTQGLDYAPLYYIAACSNDPLPNLPALSMFGDQDESVYAHYYHEIRKNMSAGARIQQLEAELDDALSRLRALESAQ